VTPAEQAIVSACERLREHRALVDQDVVARDDALLALWQESGLPKARVGETVRGLLQAQGWSADDIARVGVSGPSVLAALGRRRQG